MFLVVVENGADALDTRVFVGGEVLLHGGLVPIEDATDERRDEEGAGFGGSNGLYKRKHQGQVAVDALFLEDFCGFDALPSRGNLDQNAGLVNADIFVKLACCQRFAS